MPSGTTHDRITLALCLPAAVAAYTLSHDIFATLCGTAGFLFGGLMFGPDLDTRSKPYSRWGLARIIWLPYRWTFPHRSRWTHGMIFGTLIRVLYFSGIVTIVMIAAAFITAPDGGGETKSILEIAEMSRMAGSVLRESGVLVPIGSALLGVWAGAVSHTLTDLVITYIRTGRRGDLF